MILILILAYYSNVNIIVDLELIVNVGMIACENVKF